jgi:hypothetical protein
MRYGAARFCALDRKAEGMRVTQRYATSGIGLGRSGPQISAPEACSPDARKDPVRLLLLLGRARLLMTPTPLRSGRRL